MRLINSTLTVTAAILVAASASAQANPFQTRVETGTGATGHGLPSSPACPSNALYGTPVANASLSSVCSIDASTGNGSGLLDAGTFTTIAKASVTSNLPSTSVSMYGTVRPNGQGDAFTAAQNSDFIQILNPVNIFRIVVTTTFSGSSWATSNSQDFTQALGLLGAYSVDLAGQRTNYLGEAWREDGAGVIAYLHNLTHTCDRSHACTVATTASPTISMQLFGSDLNANGIFEAVLFSTATHTSYNGTASDISVDLGSSVALTLPVVTLYDAAGNDVTGNYVITQDASVTATPEPASLMLFGTGLLSLMAVARRRRSRRG